jgi:hypothetical protein
LGNDRYQGEQVILSIDAIRGQTVFTCTKYPRLQLTRCSTAGAKLGGLGFVEQRNDERHVDKTG